MVDITELKKFLNESNKAGYATGEEKKWVKEVDGSTTIPFTWGDWKSHDNFFGGEPYGGRVVVFYKEKPVWMMIYYGWVEKTATATSEVYSILQQALKAMPEEYPFRGPKELVVNDFTYENQWAGDLERYSGEEKITNKGEVVYRAFYRGGLVDVVAGDT